MYCRPSIDPGPLGCRSNCLSILACSSCCGVGILLKGELYLVLNVSYTNAAGVLKMTSNKECSLGCHWLVARRDSQICLRLHKRALIMLGHDRLSILNGYNKKPAVARRRSLDLSSME